MEADDSEEEMEAAPVKQWKKSDVSNIIVTIFWKTINVCMYDVYTHVTSYVALLQFHYHNLPLLEYRDVCT